MAEIANTTRRGALKGAIALTVGSIGTAAVAAEMANLFDLIEKHRTAYALFNELSPYSDEMDERFDPARAEEFETANDKERASLEQVIAYKTETFKALKAKAVYLAEIDNNGSLGYEQAFDFIHSIAGI